MKKITFKSAFLAAIALFGWNMSANSQVTLKYPDATPDAPFTTIQAAYNAIDFAAHAGAHTIQIDATPSAEVYPITLGAKTDASATNSILIKPASNVKITLAVENKTVIYSDLSFVSGATTLSVSNVTGVSAGMAVYGFGFNFYSTPYRYSTVSTIDAVNNTITVSDAASAASTAGRKIFVGTPGTQTIVFDGAKYVTIDGVSRTGNTGLEIQNTNSINCQTIYFKNNAQYNTIQNCIIRGANISGNVNNGTAGTIYFGGGQYNTITNNDVCDMGDPDNIPYPICAFQMVAGGGTNNSNTISGNNVYNISNLHSPNGPCTFMQFGSTGSANNWVLDNKFFWKAPTSFSSASINYFNCGTLSAGNRFEGNTIGYTLPDGTGTAELTFLGSGGTIVATPNAKFFTCKNNTVANMKITGTTGAKAFVCMQIVPTGGTASDDNCLGNTIQNIELNSNGGNGTLYGIFVSAAPIYNLDIKNNTIKNLTCQSSTATFTNTIYGMSMNFGAPNPVFNVNCIGNEISNITAGNDGSSAANNIIGILQGGAAGLMEKNLLYSLNSKSTGTTSVIKGLRFALSNSNGAIIKNNIVRLGTDVTSDVEIHGIFHEATSSDSHIFNFYHNTVFIGGTSSTKNSHIFTHTGVLKSVVTLKNNIFSNVRTGGAAVNEIYNLATSSDITSSEYNMYQYNGQFAYTSTTPATTSYPTLGDWNVEKLDFETGSKNQQNPLFADATASTPDMHVATGSPANESGIALAAVTDDFAGAIRSNYVTAETSNADMGAYAISNSTAVETAKQTSNLSVVGLQNNIRFANLSGKTASVYSFAGQLLKSVKLTSDNVNVPAAKGLYLVNINGEVTKVMVK